jgi:hypothetical protein
MCIDELRCSVFCSALYSRDITNLHESLFYLNLSICVEKYFDIKNEFLYILK